MRYIIIIDNNLKCAKALKALLQLKAKETDKNNYMIATCECQLYDDINQAATQICTAIQKIYENEDNEIHFLIDLLITESEEQNLDYISDKITGASNERKIATGIQLANIIRSTFYERVTISFMSKWLNLQNGIPIKEYNGIQGNPLWDNHKIRSFLNPINENGCIINRTLQMPESGAKTVVDAASDIAFDFQQEDK